MVKTTQIVMFIYVLTTFSSVYSPIARANGLPQNGKLQSDVASSQVVARMGNGKVTLGQAEDAQPDQLEGARSKVLQAQLGLFMAERQAAIAAIDKQLVEAQAAKEHISSAELLKKHVDDQIKDPSDEAIRIYYLGPQTQMPYNEARPKIVDHVRKLEQKKALEDYVASLQKAADVKVTLLPPRVDVTVGDSPSIGPVDAPITLVEFADYQCPYCHQMEPVVQSIREQYGDKIRLVFKNFPLPNHQYAEKAGEAALCAGQQGQYWPYHDRLFASTGPNDLEVSGLKKTAADLKLDTARFDTCLDSGAEAATVAKTLAEGKAIGIGGTPSFTINGYFLSGAIPQEVLTDVIDVELMKASRQATSQSGWRAAFASKDGGATRRPAEARVAETHGSDS
jgi:protein-disulfide isomerase